LISFVVSAETIDYGTSQYAGLWPGK